MYCFCYVEVCCLVGTEFEKNEVKSVSKWETPELVIYQGN